MKNNKIVLSVIMPLYNASKTLSQCLTSIQLQKNVELEIICVDDESTDNTLELCEHFREKDQRIKIVSKNNGGVASARNKGLNMAEGEYVTFIDQDDWIENDAYTILLPIMNRKSVDLIVFNYTKDYEGNIQRMVNRKEVPSLITKRDDLIRYAFYREEYRGFAAFVWNKIFRRDFLIKNNISFDGLLRRGDDVLFFSEVAIAEPQTVYVNEYLYHYVQRHDSITHTQTSGNIVRLGEILIGYNKAIQKLERSGISSDSISYMKCFHTFHASKLYELAKKERLTQATDYYRNEMLIYIEEYIKQNQKYEDRLKRISDLLEVDKE